MTSRFATRVEGPQTPKREKWRCVSTLTTRTQKELPPEQTSASPTIWNRYLSRPAGPFEMRKMMSMKTRTTVASIAGVGLLLAGCSSGSGEADGDSVELRLGGPFAASHIMQAAVLNDWVEEVGEESDGSISIDIVPSQALAPAASLYENTVSGAQELGWSLQTYTPGRFPITELIQTPLTFSSAEQATNVLWDLYEEYPEFQEEYDDVHVVALWTTDTGHVWTTDSEIDSDLSGKTFRSPGAAENTFITALGSTPVGMPAPEMYDAVERGVVDGVFLQYSGLESFNLLELVNSGLECNCYTSAQFIVMNRGVWDGLTEDQRQVLEDLSGRELSLRLAKAYEEHTATVRQDVKEAGITVNELPSPLPEKWATARDATAEELVAHVEDAGAPGQEIFDRLIEIAEG